MAQVQYVYVPSKALWYPINGVEIDGEITTQIAQTGGVTNPPPYIGAVGEALLNEDYYLAFTQTLSLPVDTPTFNLFALIVSDQIENYCRQSWRIQAVAVPLSVQYVAALVIRDLMVSKATNTGLYKSYSGGDYSWSLADGVTPGDILAPYKSLLNPYRELSIYA